MESARENIRLQQVIAIVGVALFVTKLVAWYLTGSIAILTDALESTINVVAGFVGLYSLYLSAQPKDKNHPYGHGKVEFVSAAIEGTIITVAGGVIIYEAILNLKNPKAIGQLDYGIYLVSATAIVNFGIGFWAVKRGKRNKSLALIASGKHLQSDTYSTLGIIVGLVLIWITDLEWLDSAVALLFAGLIIYTGIKILRGSLAGIMDEADTDLLNEVVATLEKERRPNWVDLHNLRIIKYGGTLHLDCHLTVPWYLNVHQAHEEVDELGKVVRNHFGDALELFVHTDGCLDFSCGICTVADCTMRKDPLEKRVTWTVENVSTDKKHRA